MRIQLITIGKLKEKFLKQACDEYQKRLQAYAKIEVIELAEEKCSDQPSDAEIEQVLRKEGERIQKALHPDSFAIVLAVNGEMVTSPGLAKKLDHLTTYGHSHFSFIIGGSHGLSKEVYARASWDLSFSKMTFPHQLMRVFLLEQIYRACKINRGETYHK
ncbi:23S rRNA (pseudouridine1915-N3)-methyltransferase [Croceifilum oryzae]|uniref:Ribosomal RNA large subunit methyltransferase H n=1 Tax=Croceifilum oryzae TaxID=1553429 RepID=A0AAJ1WSX0_9BACL|nr:23S rRNA (pseudouridine(1915)-N(3))-methyltransferase RlmH [Croceifilum oryzae]MDQ0417833.1 23S rRNA (pseudouridine1915-N3)-methyltransferase [Croceifilum oryzae]